MTATQPTTTQKRNKLFDGSKNRHGLSKLLLDIFVIPIQEKIIEETKKNLCDGYDKLDLIITETSSELNLSIEEIRSKDRHYKYIIARQIIVFLARYTTNLSLKQLGKELSIHSPKHHTSIINNTKKAFYLIHNPDKNFLEIFNRVRQRLDAHYGIVVDLDNFDKMPDWYKKMLTKG